MSGLVEKERAVPNRRAEAAAELLLRAAAQAGALLATAA